MRELEDSLGYLLLNRTSRGVSPTVYGLMFKRHAEQTLRDHRRTLDELRALKSGTNGHARIGMAPAFSGYLPKSIHNLIQAKPGITFEVVEGTYDALVQRTLRGEIEGAFTMLPPAESIESLAVRSIGEEPIVVVVDASHPLCDSENLELASLGQESWIVMNRPRSIVQAFYQLAGAQGIVSPKISIETDSLDFLKSMIRNSTLLAALPKGAVYSELCEGVFRALDVGNLPDVGIAFVHRHGVMPPLVIQLVREVEATLKSLSATPYL